MMIQTLVKAQHLNGMAAFLCASGHTDDPAAFDFTDLPNRRTYGPRCRGNHQSLTRFGLPDIQQPHIGGKARHSQNAQRPGRMGGIFAQFDQTTAVREVVLLPAAVSQHPFPCFKIRMT
ncbi:Uncharacterised protein [Enterobacter cloacae]|nr:Uncharacterised protein [Enterobacter cloacae]